MTRPVDKIGPKGFGDRRMDYRIPLSDDSDAVLSLPVELTRSDADRICAIVSALAFNDAEVAAWRARREAQVFADQIVRFLLFVWTTAPGIAPKVRFPT